MFRKKAPKKQGVLSMTCPCGAKIEYWGDFPRGMGVDFLGTHSGCLPMPVPRLLRG